MDEYQGIFRTQSSPADDKLQYEEFRNAYQKQAAEK